MSRTLTSHIVADLLRIMTLTASVLVAVIAFGAAIRPIMQNLIGGAELPHFVGLASVPMLQFALPFAGAFAGTIVYGRLAADNEILSMSAAGMSYRKILFPAAVLGFVMFFAMAILVDVAVPRFWTSIERLITKDPTRLFITAVEKGEAFAVPGTGTQLYADEAKIMDTPKGPGAPVTRLALAGVAAIEVGPDGRTETEFTAEFATVDIYRENDSAYLKLLFRNATAFRDGEEALVYVPLAEPEAIDLGKGIRLKPKHMDLRGLLAVWNDIDAYHAVREARSDAEATLSASDRWRCVQTSIEQTGILRLGDVGARRIYEIRNARLVGTSVLPRTGTQVELVELERGIATRRAFVNEATFLAETRTRVGGVHFELLARADTVADLRGLGGGGRWPPRIVGLMPEGCTTNVRDGMPAQQLIDECRGETIAAVAANAQSPIVQAEAAARSAGVELARQIQRTRADIVARIVQRINQSLAAPLMLLLGAALAVRLRGANPLQVYLLAFIPSILDILLISGGEQMLKQATTVSGVLVATSGNVALCLMILVAYRQIARN